MDEIELIKARGKVRFEGAYDEDWNKHSGYVYTYTDLADNTVKYVGQTMHMLQRYEEHLSQKEFSTRRWLVKYMIIDPYCMSGEGKDLRNKMLDIEYLFIKYLDKEFRVFINESAKEEYSNLQRNCIIESKLRSILPDLQMATDIITSRNLQKISDKLELEYTNRIRELQGTIASLKHENRLLKKKITSICG